MSALTRAMQSACGLMVTCRSLRARAIRFTAASTSSSAPRLDTDWYESTKHEINHLYERLQPGGVLIVDDYGSWQGSKDAIDEFMGATGEPLLLTQVGRGRVAVKPGLASRSQREG